MARPGRSEDSSEDTSVPIWLKLSAVDSAKMDQVLARPEFEGWTKGEWCLEIIQTALRYYTRPRPAGEPGRKRAPGTRAAESAPTPAETMAPPAETTPPPGRAAPARVRPARDAADRPPTAARRTSPSRGPEPVAPERPRLRQPPEPEQRQPRRAARPKPPPPPESGLVERGSAEAGADEAGSAEAGADEAGPAEVGRVESAPFDLAEDDSVPETECSHPAEARDYQSGTCAACGAILWD